jgi:hypothetical protein
MCQLQHLHELADDGSKWDIALEFLRDKLRFLNNQLMVLKNLVLQGNNPSTKREKPIIKIDPSKIRTGDLIKVRHEAFIKNLLGPEDKYKGCPFMPEMFEYCGKTYEVLKEIDFFYDEIKKKLCRCRDVVILKGVICDGKKRMDPRRCDLNCFFFWHKAWLEKL